MNLTLSQKGWVVIPAEIRKKYNLHPGSSIRMVDYGGVLSLIPALENPARQGFGLLNGGKSLTKALLEERRKELEREG